MLNNIYNQTCVDEKYGCMWHVVVGENFTANITAEVNIPDMYNTFN